jgi:hypothetical protein
MSTRYNTPSDLEVDRYGHLVGVETDPYGNLEFAIGSGDDFVCFDYSLQEAGGRTVFVLHGTLNSETGSFIQDFDYVTVDINDPRFHGLGEFEAAVCVATRDMIGQALDWVVENEVRLDKKGWNQDPYYLLRSVCAALDDTQSEPNIRRNTSKRGWSLRYGGKKINAACGGIGDFPADWLPISRKPRFP